ncbi:ribosome small subunit-dependent GTPase A [bacterium]|nr:ribosome small subunit-dependent GTPase A [bacterium]
MLEISDLGFSSFFADQVDDSVISENHLARVSAEHRSEYEILCRAGVKRAQLSRNHFKEFDQDMLPKVGDWVILVDNSHPLLIEKVLDRKTTLSRGAAGNETANQVLATNVDVVFVVAGLDSEFNSNRIERYLSMVWSSGAVPVVVLNKADLADDPTSVQIETEAHSPGVDVLLASSVTNEGLDQLRSHLHVGVTAAFVGPSGVGKSTLINALIGEASMDTSEVRSVDSKGRHTTVHRQLIMLPGGGMVIDTPGLRELQLTDAEGIDSVFPEIEALAEECRFRDCTHQSEPGCAVKAGVESGEIKADRYEHYLKLQHDAQSFEIRQDERLYRQKGREWGKLSREGDMIRKLKGTQ